MVEICYFYLFFSLILDQSDKLQEGCRVQILGEIQLSDKNEPILSARIIRDFRRVDPASYHKATALQAKYCPLNIKRSSKDDSNLEDSEYHLHEGESEDSKAEEEVKKRDPDVSLDLFDTSN